MTKVQFEAVCRAFARRRPFRAFWIEFTSGNHVQVGHPELIRNEGDFYIIRRPDGGYVAFTAASVSRLLDLPIPGAQ